MEEQESDGTGCMGMDIIVNLKRQQVFSCALAGEQREGITNKGLVHSDGNKYTSFYLRIYRIVVF